MWNGLGPVPIILSSLCRLTRNYSTIPRRTSQFLWNEYRRAKILVDAVPKPHKIDPDGVFTNNELNLKEVEVYGFDYDYTLAIYKKDLNELIYELALQRLVDHYKVFIFALKTDFFEIF